MAALYHYSSEAEIVRIGEGFLDLSPPREEWPHGAHWAAAFWIILTRPGIAPERDMPGLIRRYNEAKGRSILKPKAVTRRSRTPS